jgi:hypothetical protein
MSPSLPIRYSIVSPTCAMLVARIIFLTPPPQRMHILRLLSIPDFLIVLRRESMVTSATTSNDDDDR